MEAAVRAVMTLYPRVFYVCHTRHLRDPRTRAVLSAHQVGILDHLDEVEPTTLSGLAAHMGVTLSTMSLSIERLVRGGFVRRARNTADNRTVDLLLTAAGLRIRNAQTVLDPWRVWRMLSRLTRAKRRRVTDARRCSPGPPGKSCTRRPWTACGAVHAAPAGSQREKAMLKWSLIVVGVLAGLVLLIAAIGMLLPRGHVASRSVRLQAGREKVWEIITNFAEHPAWRTDLARVERLPDREGHEVWNEVRRNGEAMPLETLECVRPTKLVRRIADANLPFGGTWTFELAEAGEGCTLMITERGEVYNPIFRTVSRLFDLRATIDGFLSAVGARLGEKIALED